MNEIDLIHLNDDIAHALNNFCKKSWCNDNHIVKITSLLVLFNINCGETDLITHALHFVPAALLGANSDMGWEKAARGVLEKSGTADPPFAAYTPPFTHIFGSRFCVPLRNRPLFWFFFKIYLISLKCFNDVNDVYIIFT